MEDVCQNSLQCEGKFVTNKVVFLYHLFKYLCKTAQLTG